MMRTIVLIVMALSSMSGMSQDLQLETQEILDVIKKWNFAVNAHSEKTLRELYADRVIYYAEQKSRAGCIDAKNNLFASDPSYRQKIISDPTFVAYTAGVVKSSFTREVFENGRWRKVPSYLLISYDRNSYKITGESDVETDKRARHKPALGKPMDIPQERKPAAVPDVAEIDSTISEDTTQLAVQDTIDASTTEREDSTVISSVTEELLSDETVAVPKKYVYILIGLLALTAIIMLFSRGQKRRKPRSNDRQVRERETMLIRNNKTFESFITALFDPHFFTLQNHTRQKVYAGRQGQPDFAPSLEFDFRNKEANATIAIECIFIPQLASRQILSYSANQINRYLDFEEGTGTEVYLIVGLEGDPHDPKELFLIPVTELREGYLGYQDMQPFRKHGMFFYNPAKRRLV